jgi:hypothetical protein
MAHSNVATFLLILAIILMFAGLFTLFGTEIGGPRGTRSIGYILIFAGFIVPAIAVGIKLLEEMSDT